MERDARSIVIAIGRSNAIALRATHSLADQNLTERDIWANELLHRAHERAVRASTPEMATFLQDLVGQKLTAMMAGIDDPKALGKWARGSRSPRGDAARRLREAFHVAILMSLGESPQTARAWFMGMNPYLNDRAPAEVFASSEDGGARAMRAARTFLAHG